MTLADLQQDDYVVEVGPGVGTLTVALLPRVAGVIAIEKDASLLPALLGNVTEDVDTFKLIHGDALDVDREQIAATSQSMCMGMPNKLVANLPYAVAATIVLEYFKQMSSFAKRHSLFKLSRCANERSSRHQVLWSIHC